MLRWCILAINLNILFANADVFQSEILKQSRGKTEIRDIKVNDKLDLTVNKCFKITAS